MCNISKEEKIESLVHLIIFLIKVHNGLYLLLGQLLIPHAKLSQIVVRRERTFILFSASIAIRDENG